LNCREHEESDDTSEDESTEKRGRKKKVQLIVFSLAFGEREYFLILETETFVYTIESNTISITMHLLVPIPTLSFVCMFIVLVGIVESLNSYTLSGKKLTYQNNNIKNLQNRSGLLQGIQATMMKVLKSS
jgi:hypothetical protein